ncbi:hypothetical protein [Nocardioides sp.]|uniref:hypothetical protein n=1 Tax=Nocardioides sp. TaxID=35761 RepID=UPI00272459B3|nr:hypothetical protein [Nocardioides sp.]MDO9455153.1 hypothetical protein [Nocardioides sp.]
MTATYDVRVANLSVRNRQPAQDLDRLVDGWPHLVALCEVAGGWPAVVHDVAGYRYVGRRDGTHGSREVALLVRGDVEVVDSGVVQLSEAVPRSLVAHDRWGAWARVVLPGGRRALAYSTHRNAWVQRRDGTVRPVWRGTREYRAHVRAELALLDRHTTEGWPVLGGGDFNYRVPCGKVRFVDDAWPYAPHRTFPQLGLHYVAHGLDGVCHDPVFEAVGGLDVIGRATTGSDHDWITLTVRA